MTIEENKKGKNKGHTFAQINEKKTEKNKKHGDAKVVYLFDSPFRRPPLLKAYY